MLMFGWPGCHRAEFLGGTDESRCVRLALKFHREGATEKHFVDQFLSLCKA